MLYTLFIYESNSGVLIYDKNFQEIPSAKLELFSSFFSAIKSFVSEMIFDGSKELRNIELGDYTVIITSIKELQADLVMIADKEDGKRINKIIPKVLKILLNHKDLFLQWDGEQTPFKILEQPLTEFILSQKKLTDGATLIESPEQFLKTMWAHKKEVPSDIHENVLQERDFLIERLEKTTNLLRKHATAKKILELTEQLKDHEGFLEIQIEISRLNKEVADTKLKLKYFLNQSKSALSRTLDHLGCKSLKEGDYKDTYINLYSFTSKLKTVTSNEDWQNYRDLAKVLIDKEEVSDHELSEVISAILKMKDDIEEYLI